VPGAECPVECRDLHDVKFFALAIEAGADLLVSGDEDIHAAVGFTTCPILRPEEFKVKM